MKLYILAALSLLGGFMAILMIGCEEQESPQDIGGAEVEILTAAAPELFRDPATPPEQPSAGPGGSDYTHTEVRESVYGIAGIQYWIFEPASPIPDEAPVIVFNHGWLALNPCSYMGWIEHIVKKGNIVVHPRYQFGRRTPPRRITYNAIGAVKDAIARLQDGGHVYPRLDKFAIIGHSAGAIITVNMAALAEKEGIPKPLAIMSVEPAAFLLFGEELELIPADTLVLVLVGSDDHLAGDSAAKRIFYATPQIPLANKDFITVVTDRYGRPDLVADHMAPTATSCFPDPLEVDALDYYAYWKLFEALTDYAFYGKNGEYALGNTPKQRYMGLWSDGMPVKELLSTDQP